MCSGTIFTVTAGQCVDLSCTNFSIECAHIAMDEIPDVQTGGIEAYSFFVRIEFKAIRNDTNVSLVAWCHNAFLAMQRLVTILQSTYLTANSRLMKITLM